MVSLGKVVAGNIPDIISELIEEINDLKERVETLEAQASPEEEE